MRAAAPDGRVEIIMRHMSVSMFVASAAVAVSCNVAIAQSMAGEQGPGPEVSSFPYRLDQCNALADIEQGICALQAAGRADQEAYPPMSAAQHASLVRAQQRYDREMAHCKAMSDSEQGICASDAGLDDQLTGD
jgi:hypothetical protein